MGPIFLPLVLFSRAARLCGGKILGDPYRYVASGGPFCAAEQGRPKADAVHRVIDVTERGVEDAALAVAERHKHRFISPRTLLLGVGVGGGEYANIFRRATQFLIKFIFGVQPRVWQAAHNGMVGITRSDQKLVLRAVAATSSWRFFVDDQLVRFEIEVGSSCFLAPAPTPQANHLIVLWPIGKGVVRGVDGDEAATAVDVGLKFELRFAWPGVAVVVADNDIEVGKIGAEAAHVLVIGGRGSHIDCKSIALGKVPFHDRGRDLPFVIVLAVDDQHLERPARPLRGGRRRLPLRGRRRGLPLRGRRRGLPLRGRRRGLPLRGRRRGLNDGHR